MSQTVIVNLHAPLVSVFPINKRVVKGGATIDFKVFVRRDGEHFHPVKGPGPDLKMYPANTTGLVGFIWDNKLRGIFRAETVVIEDRDFISRADQERGVTQATPVPFIVHYFDISKPLYCHGFFEDPSVPLPPGAVAQNASHTVRWEKGDSITPLEPCHVFNLDDLVSPGPDRRLADLPRRVGRSWDGSSKRIV